MDTYLLHVVRSRLHEARELGLDEGELLGGSV
jgi:hypothetical protein